MSSLVDFLQTEVDLLVVPVDPFSHLPRAELPMVSLVLPVAAFELVEVVAVRLGEDTAIAAQR